MKKFLQKLQIVVLPYIVHNVIIEWNRIPIKSRTLILILVIFCVGVSVHDVYAAHVNWVGDPFSLNVGTADHVGQATTQVIVRVNDATANTNPLSRQEIQVTITSTGDPTGIILTLQETGVNTGIFENTNLALMNGNDVFSLSNTATVTISDTAGQGTINGDSSIIIFSDTDTNGITPIFTETTSGTYTATIRFAAATNSLTNTLGVSSGDFITVDDTTGGNRANGMITPNPSGFRGAISTGIGQTVTATYQGHTDSFVVSSFSGPGRGGGGLVAPGLVVDAIASIASRSSGNGCIGDCVPPTLGVDDTYKRFVEAGFSYNDHPVDVELYYTHYPLVTVNVGQENKVVLKIYDNSGIGNIQHVELAFGLANGEILDESKASISLDIDFGGTRRISTYDPESVLENIRVETSSGKCSSFISQECLIVIIYHTFRAPLDFNIVATDVWDLDKNAWQNYYNDGINVIGESLNPPKTHIVLSKGHPIKITESGKNSAVDENGNSWTFDREWIMNYVPPKKIEPLTSHGYQRNTENFTSYKKEQEYIAEKILEKILSGKKIHNEITPAQTIDYSYVSRHEDVQLQITKEIESIRAEEFLGTLNVR